MNNRALAQSVAKIGVVAAKRNENAAATRHFIDSGRSDLDNDVAAFEDVRESRDPRAGVHVRNVIKARLAASTTLDQELGFRMQPLDIRRNQSDAPLPGCPFSQNADDDLLCMGIHFFLTCTMYVRPGCLSRKMCTFVFSDELCVCT